MVSCTAALKRKMDISSQSNHSCSMTNSYSKSRITFLWLKMYLIPISLNMRLSTLILKNMPVG